MLPRREPTAALLTLAADQDGVVTTAQALASGLPEQALYRLERTARWQRLDRSVYLTAPGPAGWRSLARAGVLLGGEQARLGGTAAGYLHGLVPVAPSQIRVLVPGYAVTRSRGPWRFGRERDGVRERSVGTPPRTSVEDTVLDLCDLATSSRAVAWSPMRSAPVGQRLTSCAWLCSPAVAPGTGSCSRSCWPTWRWAWSRRWSCATSATSSAPTTSRAATARTAQDFRSDVTWSTSTSVSWSSWTDGWPTRAKAGSVTCAATTGRHSSGR